MQLYDDPSLFRAYSQMDRSKYGLSAAGEWHQLQKLIPDVSGKAVLDIGCGYGWHSRYCLEQGAAYVLGIDASAKMIAEAEKRSRGLDIGYRVCALEDFDYPFEFYDFIISNLVLHYVEDLNRVFRDVCQALKPDGVFLFNIEHPTFTSSPGQDWIYQSGKPAYWPVDRYFYPGQRETNFLDCTVKKYHHTLTQILGGMLDSGFMLEAVEEAIPSEEMAIELPDEMRRPMMLLVKGRKKKE